MSAAIPEDMREKHRGAALHTRKGVIAMRLSSAEHHVRTRYFTFALIATTLILALLAPLASADTVQDENARILSKYGVPGEQVDGCYPVTLEGRQYLTYVFTVAGSTHDESLNQGRFLMLTPEQWNQDYITGVIVIREADNTPEVNREVLYKVLDTLKFGYNCYFKPPGDVVFDPQDVGALFRKLESASGDIDADLWQALAMSNEEQVRYKVALSDMVANPAWFSAELDRESGVSEADQQKWVEAVSEGAFDANDLKKYVDKFLLTTGDLWLSRRLAQEQRWVDQLADVGDEGDVEFAGRDLDAAEAGVVLGAALEVLNTVPFMSEASGILERQLSVEKPRDRYGDNLAGALGDVERELGVQKALRDDFTKYVCSVSAGKLDGEPSKLAEGFFDYLHDDGATAMTAMLASDIEVSDGRKPLPRQVYEAYSHNWGSDKALKAAMTDMVYGYRVAKAMDEVMADLVSGKKPDAETGYSFGKVSLYRDCYLVKNLALATCYTSLATVLNEEKLNGALSAPSRDILGPALSDQARRDEATKVGIEAGSRLVNDMMYTATMRRAVAQAQSRAVNTTESVYTVLLMDNSGSMDLDMGDENVSKLDAAKGAARQIIQLSDDYKKLADKAGVPTKDNMSVISFATDIKLVQDWTTDTAALNAAIDGITAPNQGFTDMSGGVEKALEKLQSVTSTNARKSIILLTDGKPTSGITDQNEFLSKYVPLANSLGVTIYTVGIKDTALDQEFLKKLAEQTGGAYFYTQNQTELLNTYLRLRLKSLGTTTDKIGEISQGQTTSLSTVKVPANSGEIHAVLNWQAGQGVQINWKITGPDGKTVDLAKSPPDVHAATSADGRQYLVINKPDAGDWKFAIEGTTVPGKVAYYAGVSVRPLPKPGQKSGRPQTNWTLIIILAVCGGALIIIVGGYLFVRYRRREKAPKPPREKKVKEPRKRPCPGCGKKLSRDWTRCPYCDWSSEGAVPPKDTPTPPDRQAPPPAPDIDRPLPPPGTPQVITPVTAGVGAPGSGQYAEAPGAQGAQYDPGYPVCHLEILSGENAGGYYVIDTDLVTIGRDYTNHIVLDEDTVSAFHARLYWLEGGFFIEDLDSTNGTFVNNEPVVNAWLVEGSQLRIGETVFLLRLADGQ